jgi:hypothetical protein
LRGREGFEGLRSAEGRVQSRRGIETEQSQAGQEESELEDSQQPSDDGALREVLPVSH